MAVRPPSHLRAHHCFASYLANKDEHPDELGSPQLSFAFAYLASHHGLELASPEVVDEVMEHVYLHRDRLAARVADEGL